MKIDDAEKILKRYLSNKNLVKHCLAVGAIMEGVARELNQRGKKYDTGEWKIAGLVHDIDYDMTAGEPEKHSLAGASILRENGFNQQIVYTVKAHNQAHGLPLKSDMDISLYASDPLSGLIVASALISPDKRLDSIDGQFVLNRFVEKSFARGADRNQIMFSKKLGILPEQFICLGLEAMQKINKRLGL